MKKVRINKYLADCGVAARRSCDKLIGAGKVKINGITALNGNKVDPKLDIVTVNNRKVEYPSAVAYIIVNKPVGYVTTTKDNMGRKTVMDLLPEEASKHRVYPAGRLDYDSSGLVLLTNNGELAHKITHPKHEHTKIYLVEVFPQPTNTQLSKLRTGVELANFKTSPAGVRIKKETKNGTILEFSIHEGKYRQIRRMCQAVGLEVCSLKRIQVGPIELGNLGEGGYRYLTPDEIQKLENSVLKNAS